MVIVYRAYCDDPMCKWEAPDTWRDEENAYTDLNYHIQMEHTSMTGVRRELK